MPVRTKSYRSKQHNYAYTLSLVSEMHAKLPEILWDMNHGGCSFAEFNLFHNTGFKSVVLGIYCFLENVRYWAGLAELWLSIRLHL